MQNPTFPNSPETIPLIFFETIKNNSHHKAGVNCPSFVGAKEITLRRLYDFLGVDYIAF